MLTALMAMFVGGAVSAQSYPIVITPEITALEYPDKTSLRMRFDFNAQNLGDDVVTAIGWEVHGLPAGLSIALGTVPEGCPLLIDEEPDTQFPNHVRTKRPEPLVLDEGQPSQRCNPIVTDGVNPLEFYILNETPTGLNTDNMPSSMEVELNDPQNLAQSIPTVSIIYRYRLGAGPEVNNVDEPDSIEIKAAFVSYCANVQGDVDSSGAVTPQDAQNVFEYYLGSFGGELSDYCAQCDGDDTGAISPGDAQAIFDVFLGNKAVCDGSFKTQAK